MNTTWKAFQSTSTFYKFSLQGHSGLALDSHRTNSPCMQSKLSLSILVITWIVVCGRFCSAEVRRLCHRAVAHAFSWLLLQAWCISLRSINLCYVDFRFAGGGNTNKLWSTIHRTFPLHLLMVFLTFAATLAALETATAYLSVTTMLMTSLSKTASCLGTNLSSNFWRNQIWGQTWLEMWHLACFWTKSIEILQSRLIPKKHLFSLT